MLKRKRKLIEDLDETVHNIKCLESNNLAYEYQLNEAQNDLNQKREQYQDESRRAELRLATLRNELNIAKEEFDKKNETLGCLKNDLQMLKKNCSEVDQQKAALQAEIEYLSAEGEQLKTVSIPELLLQQARLKEDFDVCLSKKESIEEEITKKEHDISEIETHCNQIRKEKEELLKRVSEEEVRLEKEYEEEMEASEESLKKKTEKLEADKKDFSEYFEKSKIAYREKTEALQAERDGLEKNKKIWKEQIAQDEAENERLASQIVSMEASVKKMENEIADNKLRLEQLTDEERTLSEKIRASQKKISDIVHSNERLYQQYSLRLEKLEMVTPDIHDDIKIMVSNHCDTISRDIDDSLKCSLNRVQEDMANWKNELEEVRQFLQNNAL